MIYSTYLGGKRPGSAGLPAVNLGSAIAVDKAGSAYVTGRTLCSDFPVRNALQPKLTATWDGYLAKLSPDGSMLSYSTYLGAKG